MASTDHRERSYVPPSAGRAGGRAFRYLSFLFVHVAVLPRRRRGSVCPSSVPVPFLHLRTSRVLAPPNLRPPSHGPKSSVPGSSASRQVSNAPSRRISSRCSGYPLSPFLRSHPLQDINSWSFNPFQLNEASEGHALKYVGFELFNRYGFMDRFKVGRLPRSRKTIAFRFHSLNGRTIYWHWNRDTPNTTTPTTTSSTRQTSPSRLTLCSARQVSP